MANPEHVELLVTSTKEEWNAWREQCDVVPDLSGLDFVRAFQGTETLTDEGFVNLMGYNLCEADLKCADIGKTKMYYRDFARADTRCAWFDFGTPKFVREQRDDTVCQAFCFNVFQPEKNWLKLLLEGREKWNEWRSEHPQDVPELSGARITYEFHRSGITPEGHPVDLSGFDLRYAKMRAADFRVTTLDDANLSGADLRCSNFEATEARRTDFRGTDLRRCHIFLGKFMEADFSAAKSDLIDMSHIDLRRTKFSGSNLDGAKMVACDLTDAKFRETTFAGTEMDLSVFIRTEFVKADICRARLFAPRMYDLHESFPVGASTSARTTQEVLDRLDVVGLDLAAKGLDGYRSLYFRGLPDAKFPLTSTVMRDTGFRASEDVMMHELAIRRPDNISEGGSFFQKLVTARHYELPTRLLDITREPLVALYYAASDADRDADGVVHLFIVPDDAIFPYDSDTVSVLANFTRLEPDEREFLLTRISFPPVPPRRFRTVLGLSDDPTRRIRTRLNHFIAQEKPYWEDRIDARDFFRVLVVEPRQTFDRLKAHKGAFMLSAFHERFERWEVDKEMEASAAYGHLRILIPAEAKPDIRSQLKQFGVTEDVLKADLQSAAEAIAGQHRTGIDPFAR